MIKKHIVKILRYFPFTAKLLALYGLIGCLNDEGWILSVKRKMPVNSEGKELPFFTYPIIKFLTKRLNDKMMVFEYGSGNSTIWLSERVKHVVSAEHDERWYSKIKKKIQEKTNIEYLYRDLNSGEYQSEILNYNKEFDIIIIDGRRRVQCGLNSINALKENGIIIWDNSDRVQYHEGYNFLISKGFKRIDFWGLGPINFYFWCTSVFYKDENVLGI